jgi:hypothetical protein
MPTYRTIHIPSFTMPDCQTLTFPNPWTPACVFSGRMPNSLRASRRVMTTPYPVASVRPSEPPRPTGLPVMKPGSRPLCIFSNSSSIQSICCASVITSGAGTSVTGPTSLATWRTQPRQIRSCSRGLRLCGSQITPPFVPRVEYPRLHTSMSSTLPMLELYRSFPADGSGCHPCQPHEHRCAAHGSP